ncbi:LpxI family protein [Puniceibacterium confluentis]|uniref:LpxI family protein n=1 Tax=Puniceibacterium confluentis TaxID=1958944 RepID=UPI0011B485FA|nr:UDP-2,3-diacylglucosamine diphosphatase LpxI [Puniceibacterium confluentis]
MLALIAGRGALPAAVARAQSMPPLVCTLDGYAPDGLAVDVTFRIETLGSLLEELRRRGIRQVCLCGAIRRPEIDLTRIDEATMPLVPVLRDALRAGDDGALRAVIGLIESDGLQVLAAHHAAPGLLMSAGTPTTLSPPAETELDARAGESALVSMARADLGQACAVVAGQVLATEGEAGTDAMLAALARDRPEHSVPGRGILFKAPKPGQDRRADLPTIGPETAAAVARAGLGGIVIEADSVIVLDQPGVVAALDRAGLFLWSRNGAK